MFHAYAQGAGDAVASGGRYDDLLAGFGWPMPAAGFAVDLDYAAEALKAGGKVEERPRRVVVFGAGAAARAGELRGQGVPAVTAATREAAIAWASAWGFTHVLDAETGASIAPRSLSEGEP
jgi:ATP phosphoribosyltransferase regulatory subunit HisZ